MPAHAHRRAPLAGLLLLAAAPVLGAQPQQPQQPAQPQQAQAVVGPPATLSAEIRRAVVDSMAAHVERFYAVADTGRLIAEHLRARHRAGAYDRITVPALFAEALGTDLRAVNGDRHLYVVLRTPGAPVLPMGLAALPPMNVGAGPAPEPSPQQRDAGRRAHFGLGRVDVLPGNVGYFEMRGFNGLPEARDAVVAALRYLEHADAIILDVRDHGGGSGALSNFIVSHFTGPDTVNTLDLEVRAANQRTKTWTLASVPGPRRPDVPLYVLTSRGTVSAGEDLAFVLKNLGRATLVGETTTGAGRNNPTFDAGHGFATSISVSMVRDPKTGAEWEGVGVVPHVAVPPRTALAVAHQHALQALAARETSPVRRRELELAHELVEAQRIPVAVSAAALERLTGAYGERTITVEHGALVFRRSAERLGQPLTPLSATRFALGATTRLTFEPAADGTLQLRVETPVAAPLTFPRTGPAPRIPSEH